MQKICVIGAGWYGSHIALNLKKQGFNVVLLEKNGRPFQEISGTFGIRDHAGPHYPRSPNTRESCARGAELFAQEYPNLINSHSYSIYALGNKDAEGLPSKVDLDTFKKVCSETKKHEEVDPKEWGYENVISAMNVEEPSIVVGERLRSTFENYFKETNIDVKYNFYVKKLESHDEKMHIVGEHETIIADYVINTTSFKELIPTNESLPFEMDVVYQACIALVYTDKYPSDKPFSFIGIEGAFPCIMPYDDRESTDTTPIQKYILTHGKWTILGSFGAVQEANKRLKTLTDQFIKRNIKPLCEEQIKKFWPEFAERFEYSGWKGASLAKLKTEREFRSAVTFARDRIIHVFPGKVTNIFDAANESLAILKQENILTKGSYRYVKGGVIDKAMSEIREKPISDRNTCLLQTLKEISISSPTGKSYNPYSSEFSLWATNREATKNNKTEKDYSFIRQYLKTSG